MRKGIALVLSLVLVVCAAAFSGCQKGNSGTSGKQVGYQLEKPEQGEEIAVMETSMGTVSYTHLDVYKRQAGNHY